MKCMCHDRRWNGSRMGNTESTVMPEGPYVVRRGAKISTESIAAAQILIGSMDGLSPGVQLSDAAFDPHIA